MAYHDTDYFHFKLNLTLTQLEHIVDRVMVPLNRVFPQCNHICLCGKAFIRSVGLPLDGARTWVPWCGYSALPLQSVLNLSIAESIVMDTHKSRSHHGSTFK